MAEEQTARPDSPPCGQGLRLIALDGDDLAVVSTHLQDALARVDEMTFLPVERRFALMVDRFDWCAASEGRTERCRAGLHFEGVTKVSKRALDAAAAAGALNLLSISFEPSDAPAGSVLLTFSGGGVIRLDVECLEAQMRDMGPRRAAGRKPDHPVASSVGAQETR